MTPKELGELGHLEEAVPVVDPADFPPRRSGRAARPRLAQIREPAARLRRARTEQAQADRLRLLRQAGAHRRRWHSRADHRRAHHLNENGAAHRDWRDLRRAGESSSSPPSATQPRPFPGCRSKAASSSTTSGRIADRLFAVGWARRGPSGTIGTNRPDGYEVADRIAAAMPPGNSNAAIAAPTD